MAFGLGDIFGGNKAASSQIAGQQAGIDELRRQFDLTQGQINPFIQAGTQALPGVVQGTTAGGLDQRLAEIFNTDIFGSLVDERTRAVQGQLGAGGLTRSGQALEDIADVPTQIGFLLEQLLTDRGTNLAGSGLNAAQGLGSLGSGTSGNIASLLSGQGQSRASGGLLNTQAGAGALGGLFDTVTSAPDIIKGGLAIASLFSDPRLKENVELVSHIGDLGVYRWDWIPSARGTIVEACSTTGFMADEVEEKYPAHVGEFGGFKVIYYDDLLEELGCQH